jgi:large subunit ribosomal protein L22
MEVQATLRNLRIAPRKVRLVVDLVRGMRVDAAVTQLRFLNKASALPVRKLIESAAANAEHNNGLDRDGLVIKSITADGGPSFYRYRPRAMGRAAPIRKRTTHITVVLSGNEMKKAGKAEEKPKAAKAKATKKPAAKKTVKKSAKKS